MQEGNTMGKIYDVVIIGGGPAGLTAALYAGRARLSALMIEKAREGGQIINTSEIANYPGSLETESGPTLVDRMSAQVKHFGAETAVDTVESVELAGEIKVIKGLAETYQAKTVIIAAGAYPMSIGCPGEWDFVGRGVSYCATCDAPFFSGLETFVIGGGDSAVEEAIYLTKFARKVSIVHRRDELRAAKAITEKAFANPKIEFIWDSVVKELSGDGLLENVKIENVKTGTVTEYHVDPEDGTYGVFVFIGYKPQSKLFEGQITMENGYIVTDEDMKTNLPGVFAAGDIRRKSLRQVVTAAADGAIAAVQAEKYIDSFIRKEK